MHIDLYNSCGNLTVTLASFDSLRALVVKGEKINAIKLVRDLVPHWGLKECKDFVEALDFSGSVGITLAPATAPVDNFLVDVKDDLRSILVSGSDYRESLVIDLFGRVCAKVGLR